MATVAGYVRVSTEQQRENDSHVKQRERLQRWADENKHDIEFYEDIGISGQNHDRPGYQSLMGQDDELGEVVDYDIVVVRELSRFGRSLQRVTKDIERLHENDIDFVSLKENLDLTSAQGKFMMHVITAFNQFWADWSRERAYEYVEQAREEGKALGRPKKLSEAERQQVVSWHEDGLGYSTIARLVNVEFGKDVHRSTVRRYCQDAEDELEVKRP